MDELRYFLSQLDRIDDFSSKHWSFFDLFRCTADAVEWMWVYSTAVLVDAERLQLQKLLLVDIVSRIVSKDFRDDALTMLETVVPLLDPYLLTQVDEGQAGLLQYFNGMDIKFEES